MEKPVKKEHSQIDIQHIKKKEIEGLSEEIEKIRKNRSTIRLVSILGLAIVLLVVLLEAPMIVSWVGIFIWAAAFIGNMILYLRLDKVKKQAKKLIEEYEKAYPQDEDEKAAMQ